MSKNKSDVKMSSSLFSYGTKNSLERRDDRFTERCFAAEEEEEEEDDAAALSVQRLQEQRFPTDLL